MLLTAMLASALVMFMSASYPSRLRREPRCVGSSHLACGLWPVRLRYGMLTVHGGALRVVHDGRVQRSECVATSAGEAAKWGGERVAVEATSAADEVRRCGVVSSGVAEGRSSEHVPSCS